LSVNSVGQSDDLDRGGEIQRLQVLGEYDILGTPPEEAYDDLVHLAAFVCGAPMATICLVGRERNWYKAATGFIPVQLATGIETAPHSLCDHAMRNPGDVFVVEDASADPRFLNEPTVVGEPFVRFFAGSPIVNAEGFTLGALCIQSPRPGTLDEDRKTALKALTRQVAAQMELRRACLRLTGQSAELAKALESAEASSRAKSTFIGNISHEIRTPLNGVLGMTELLASTVLTERQRKFVETIRGSGQGLLGVLNDVLHFSEFNVDSKELHPVRTVVPTLIDEMIGLMLPAAEAKGVKLHYEVDPHLTMPVWVDSLRLRQILTNLLGNAIKFTPWGAVTLRVSQVDPGHQTVVIRFSVEDTGIGIPEENLDTIFEAFVQADGSSVRAYSGAGLGLSISRRLARMMNSDIEVTSRLGKGSTFSFELDLELVTDGFPTKGPSRSVLVVEDNEINSLVISAMLEDKGCLVRCVPSGLEAIEILKNHHFDMVFMDIHMPGMDGVTATRRFRELEPKEGRTPIVAVTASALAEDENRCREAGMDGFLRKPINEQVIGIALERYARK